MVEENPDEKKRDVIGLTEQVTAYGPSGDKKKRIRARVDTGAHSNSVDSKLAAELSLGPVVKTTIVKSANGEALRPVVEMYITLGGKKIKGLFTIADRSELKYRVLIGRDILSKSGFLIDPKMKG
ncbi:MAG: RimK/LysX family protein [Candidatus Nanoarchaeia archaeon]